MTFAHRLGVWNLDERCRVVGILNLTPDSFYDGGRYNDADRALERAEGLVAEGADAIDIGGQSTRPGGTPPVGAEVEWERIGSVTAALVRRMPNLPISVDTYHSDVAARALDAGAAMINDVSGLSVDPRLADVTARAGAGLVLMHARGFPDRVHEPHEYGDLVEEIRGFLADRVREAEARGVPRDRIALDPGIGFSKRAAQSIGALRALPALAELGLPLYVGLSRKSFLGSLPGGDAIPVEERLAAGLGAAVAAHALGARMFRTHDVRATKDALRAAEAVLGAGTGAGAAARAEAGAAAGSAAGSRP